MWICAVVDDFVEALICIGGGVGKQSGKVQRETDTFDLRLFGIRYLRGAWRSYGIRLRGAGGSVNNEPYDSDVEGGRGKG